MKTAIFSTLIVFSSAVCSQGISHYDSNIMNVAPDGVTGDAKVRTFSAEGIVRSYTPIFKQIKIGENCEGPEQCIPIFEQRIAFYKFTAQVYSVPQIKYLQVQGISTRFPAIGSRVEIILRSAVYTGELID